MHVGSLENVKHILAKHHPDSTPLRC
jgi:hypothetical protein